MGCGSSSTNVQTFRNPEENKHYQHQKAPSRQSSAAPSVKSQRSTDKKDRTRKSSASSVSSSGSRRRQTKADEERLNSASTKLTYTIQRPNSDVTHDFQVAPHDENENIENKVETPVHTFETEPDDKEKEANKLEAQRHHDAIQKQTFLTGDPEEESQDKIPEKNAESHEEIARRKEEKRLRYDYEKLEENLIKKHGLVALNIPEMDNGDKNADYTIDDITAHNDQAGGLDWFKYGRKIYSWHKMQPIIQERVSQYKQVKESEYGYFCAPGSTYGYPIHVARGCGVSRKELSSVLAVCLVGNCVDIPRDEYLSRMKQSAENVFEEDTDSEYFKDYRNQLGRWLADYPMNKVYNDLPSPGSDPNEVTFPLPPDIQSDPYVLRKWIETWTVFDCDVPKEGAWEMKPLLNDDWGDVHERFAQIVQETHDDGSTEPFDMTIDGDVAWIEIELDLVMNDKTTESQDIIWKRRATRTNLNDPEWMKKRREELATALKKRYEQREITYPVEDYMPFAEKLEQHWKQFQELCEKEFVRPQGNFKKFKEPKQLTNQQKEVSDTVFTADIHDRLVIGHDSEDDRSTEKSLGDRESEGRNDSKSNNILNLEAEFENDFERAESEDRASGDNRLVLNHDDAIDQGPADPESETNANNVPTFETMDSGLELDSAEPPEQVNGEQDVSNMNDDGIQLTDRPEDDGGGRRE